MSVRPLVVIEAPGKAERLTKLLRAAGVPADVWATRGHFRNNPPSLWPLALDARLQETARDFDPARVTTLRELAQDRIVWIATDPDQEGDVIARDVADAIAGIASRILRMTLHALDAAGVRQALRSLAPLSRERAVPGDARRIIDRLIGSTFSAAGRPVGRIFSAALGAAATGDPVIGHVTLLLPAADGGAPFTARVPVTVSTRALWERRLQEAQAFAATPVRETCTQSPAIWRYADVLRVAAGLPMLPKQVAA